MQKIIAFVALVSLAAPIEAAEWGMTDSRSSGFTGARLQIPLGRNSTTKVRASLTMAPLMSRRASDGRISTTIGEGIALDFAGKKPELNLGGIRADRALQIMRGDTVVGDQRSGLSTGAAIGIGAGVLVVAGLAFLIAKRTCIGEDPDFCGSD